jgi:CRISPR/Cas system-associated exonuclease Cas4 (RecB family)
MLGASVNIPGKLDVLSTPWSPSKIKDLLWCAQQYWYSMNSEYVPVLPPPPILEQGSYAHEWAEAYLKNKPFPPVDNGQIRKYRLTPEELKEISDLIVSFKTFLDDLPKLITPIIGEYEGFSEGSFAIDNKLRPTHMKNRHRFFGGKIDYYALSKTDGLRDAIIIDYKATQQTKLDPLDHELQLHTYSFLLSKYFPLRKFAVGIYYVKQQKFEWLLSEGTILNPYDEAKVVALLRSYMTRAKEAASKPDLRNRGPRCESCKYKTLCLP